MEFVKIWGAPGTGKTKTLIDIVHKAIADGYSSEQICYTSFTNAAAGEARKRAMEQFNLGVDDFPYFRTEHSICFRLLGLSRDQVFTGRRLRDFSVNYPQYRFSGDVNLDPQEARYPEAMLQTAADCFEFFVNYRQNTMLPFDDAYRQFMRQNPQVPNEFNRTALEQYMTRRTIYKEKFALWDFSDMLVKVLDEHISPPVKVLIADEMQDASRLLYRVVELWSENVDRCYIAGDPYQAIYGFQGAAPELFFEFAGEEEILKHSFRLTPEIKGYAQQIIETIRLRFPEFSPSERAGTVKREAFERVDWSNTGDAFLLARTRWWLSELRVRLMDLGVPFANERGPALTDTTKARAVVALGKLYNDRFVTDADLRAVIKHTRKPFLVHGSKAKVKKAQKGIYTKHSLWDLGFAAPFFESLNSNFMDILIMDIEDEEKSYLYKVWNKYGESGLENPGLTLTTIHGSKGREKSTVYLAPDFTVKIAAGMAVDPRPETFLSYVGVTRAIDNFVLLFPEKYYAYPFPVIKNNGGCNESNSIN